MIIAAVNLFGQEKAGITGSVEWDSMRVNTRLSLDLASAGLRLPAGRTQAEALLASGFFDLIMPYLLSLQVDSSSTVADLIERGELNYYDIEDFALTAGSVAPSLSPDMRSITSSHSLRLDSFSSSLLRHYRASPVTRSLSSVTSAQYTGIIIIAAENLPVHGMRSTALPVPCMFPKIWDSEMNLIYDRSMFDYRSIPYFAPMVHYSSLPNIFQSNPSGLSDELKAIVGERPLRIFARGVFGIVPTDLIIDRSDALLIISSEENRRLLSQGKVVFILDESVLYSYF